MQCEKKKKIQCDFSDEPTWHFRFLSVLEVIWKQNLALKNSLFSQIFDTTAFSCPYFILFVFKIRDLFL